jgi:hypothetical protein
MPSDLGESVKTPWNSLPLDTGTLGAIESMLSAAEYPEDFTWVPGDGHSLTFSYWKVPIVSVDPVSKTMRVHMLHSRLPSEIFDILTYGTRADYTMLNSYGEPYSHLQPDLQRMLSSKQDYQCRAPTPLS